MSVDVGRPAGVTTMAIVAVIAGVADILAGLGDIGIGGGFLTDVGFGETLDSVMTITGLILVLVGALALVAGFGLWRERPWAWPLARIWASICVVVGLVNAGLSVFGDTITSAIVATVIAAIVPSILGLVVLWYLYQPNVKAAFGRT